MEMKRIESSNVNVLSDKEPFILKNLFKVFPKNSKTNIVAVDNLSLGASSNQCFGLLGLNGAGKTTTFKMVIGELEPTEGDVFINGYSIRNERFEARRHLGYCGQFDFLPGILLISPSFFV
jgi:ATP-binding cassette, subfamily A (ABC1), member 3